MILFGISGDYEFIDVVVEGSRSMVMARGTSFVRSTEEYCTLVEVLPTLFVGSKDKLPQMIRIMGNWAK